jgi:hypothetical protein
VRLHLSAGLQAFGWDTHNSPRPTNRITCLDETSSNDVSWAVIKALLLVCFSTTPLTSLSHLLFLPTKSQPFRFANAHSCISRIALGIAAGTKSSSIDSSRHSSQPSTVSRFAETRKIPTSRFVLALDPRPSTLDSRRLAEAYFPVIKNGWSSPCSKRDF